MIKNFTLSGLRSTLLITLFGVLSVGISSCSKEDDTINRPKVPKVEEANAEISLKVAIGSHESEEDLKSLTLYAGTDVGRKRPHVVIEKGEQVKAYLIFAYTDKDASGNPTGVPQVLSEKPVEVTLTALEAKAAGDRNYAKLQALSHPINLPEIDANTDKAWFVSGVIGGKFNTSTKKFEFDPNPEMLGANQDFVPETKTRKVSIPYTFPWKAITFKAVSKTTAGVSRTVQSTEIANVRFRPRGLFMRFNVQNATNSGLYILKGLRFPANQGFAPVASFSFATSLDDLKTGKEHGFSDLRSGQSTVTSFPYVEKEVVVPINQYGAVKPIKISDYKYYLGKKGVTNPYIIDNPPVKTEFFWVWLADVTPGASEYTMEVVGESLATLRHNHKANLKRLQIPADKVGLTAARTINLVRTRPYMPLEFVARGNLVRSGYGHYADGTPDDVQEVGPQYGYAGSNIRGQWIAGGTFSYKEVWDWSQSKTLMSEKPAFDFKNNNRFTPAVEDWRTIIPIFRRPGEGDRDPKIYLSHYGQYIEKVKEDVMGADNTKYIFGNGGGTATTQAFISGHRNEFVRIHDWDGDGDGTDYQDIFTQANYYRLNNNTIVGTRFLRPNESNFSDRRKYYCAYRIEFTPHVNRDNPGGLKVKSVYIGDERITNASLSAAHDEDAWMQKARTEEWWKEKEEQGEVIERIFPLAGFKSPGTNREGEDGRYFVANVWGNSNYDWLSLDIHKDGRRVQLWTPGSSFEAGSLLLRLFVKRPREAFEKWGSRN